MEDILLAPDIQTDSAEESIVKTPVNHTKEKLEAILQDAVSKFLSDDLSVVDAAPDRMMGRPTDKQFAAISKFLDPDHGTSAEDWFVVTLQASDNLVSRSIRSWHPNVLNQMAALFPGAPLILNHEWEDSNAAVGFIFNAYAEKTELPPAALTDGNRGPLNKKIADRQGFQRLMLQCAVPMSDSETVESIKKRKYNCVSTGGYMTKMRLICPDCSESYGREVTFTERDKTGAFVCPHLIPDMWHLLYEGDDDYGDDKDNDDEMKPASYLVLDGIFDAVEVSLVVAGNLPLASVVRK